MRPLNSKERNKAILKVVGLFLASFIIAIFVGFTTMKAPDLSAKNANLEIQKLKNQLKFQEEVFAPNVNKTTALLSQILSSREQGGNIEVLNQDIGGMISKTKNQIAEDKSWESGMYNDVIKALSDLHLAYNAQLDLGMKISGADKLDQTLQQCINEKNQLQNQLNMLKATGGGGEDCSKYQKELKTLQQKLNLSNMENTALKKEVEKFRNP
jgi:hypothetical protein